MNQKIKKLLAVAILAATGVIQANNHFMSHNFSNNMARELINVSKAYCDNGDDDGFFGGVYVSGAYQGSFNNTNANRLGSLVFGGTTNEVSYGIQAGPITAATADYVLDGYQLGLGSAMTNSDSKVRLDPKTYQAGADFMLYVGASKMERGFYFSAHGAVGVASVDAKLTESGTIAGQADYLANQFGEAAVTPYHANLTAFFKGDTAKGNIVKLAYGKFDGKKTTGAKFGDIELALGYNFVANEDYVVGVGVRAAIPTANKPKGDWLLEPIFGRGGNWGLGGELFVKANLWASDEDNKCLNFWMKGYASHLFKAEQVRSFDATANGQGSRYMLVAKYGTDAAVATHGAASAAFQGEVGNLINYSTLPCNTTVAVEGAVAAMFDYCCDNWNVGLGFEFWGSSKEKVTITGTMTADKVFLGRQFVGRDAANVASGVCEPAATMVSQLGPLALQAQGDDNSTATLPFATLAASKITTADLNKDSAANSARHAAKVFGNLGYKWMESDYCPCLSLTGSAEFGTSKYNTVNQWSIGVQGGICF